MIEILIVSFVILASVAAVIVVYSRKNRPVDSAILLQEQLSALRGEMRASLDGNTQTINKQLIDLTNQLQNKLHQNTGTINDTRKAMDERLDNAARVIGDVQKSIGSVREALVPVSELRDILKAPKLRGGLGEIILERLLEEMLPSGMFSAQHSFSDGERVDAVIKIGGQLVPVDSKFPMDKYSEYLKASSDESRKTARKSLVTAVKKHATDVSKYIRPDEGTFPFAFMYIPSENIYYELFVGADSDETLWTQSAAKLRVFPVSSNTLYIYLQTISFGLKGMQVAEHARELLNRLEQLQKSMGDVRHFYDKTGTHLKNAQSAYDETGKRLFKLENKFVAINSEAAPELIEAGVEKANELVQ